MYKYTINTLYIILFQFFTANAACYTQGVCCKHTARLFTPDKPIIPALLKTEALTKNALSEIEILKEELKNLRAEFAIHKKETENQLALIALSLSRIKEPIYINSQIYQS